MSSDRPFQTLETDCPPAKVLSALCSNLNLDTTRTYASDKLRAIRYLINKLQQGSKASKESKSWQKIIAKIIAEKDISRLGDLPLLHS